MTDESGNVVQAPLVVPAAAEETSGNGGIASAPTSGNLPSKAAAQMQKMKDANAKYKNLLKMAKERIEQQEEELKRLRDSERTKLENDAAANPPSKNGLGEASSSSDVGGGGGGGDLGATGGGDVGGSQNWSISRVCQRIRVDLEAHELNSRGLNEEIWALVEFEALDNYPDAAAATEPTSPMFLLPPKRAKRWKKFDADADFSDFVRRDTGEPITVPPYSLTPQQSSKITYEAEKRISEITEEYRRFRVKSEMARKQMDTQIRELQSSNVETAKRRIEGQEVEKELEVARTEHNQLERMRAEMARQESQWKEAYDVLMKENEALKSSGSEALLASQWRQRYEVCLKEKEEVENKLKMADQRSEISADGGKYEMKYRDLKESFRLYRKKAKEIFEAQQYGASRNGAAMSSADMMLKISQNSDDDSKLSYLKNLMVNYFTADPEVRGHMEGAIGMVLKFTPDDVSKIEKKKSEAGWFY